MTASALRRLAFVLVAASAPASAQPAPAPPVWTRGGTCYEIFVRSFQDSDGDGIGDLKGIISRLDYLNDGNPASRTSLGVRCLWLMPVTESPSYHGYDVEDYYKVEKDYGTNADFRRLTSEAHRRGIKVLVDFVPNHSSDRNPWFVAASTDTASPYRSWYRWAATKPAEKGPYGSDPWRKSPVRDEWYYGFFSPRMPDLNYETPAVREEMKKVARYWIDSMGVDGFRLDAIQFIGEDHGMTVGSPMTHEVLRDWAGYVHGIKPDAWTVGEVFANVSTMLPYYPDQLDAHFAFEVADSLVSGVRQGKASGILPPLLRLQAALPGWRYSPFLRNHDQPRTMTELGGDMAKARLASFLLLSMPGTPFVYYGEEIGMQGGKPDEHIRTPMQWTRGKAGAFSAATPWQPYQADTATINVAAQSADPRSLLALHRALIHLRAASTALAVGDLVPLAASSDAVAAWLRRDGDRIALVVANLGKSPLAGITLRSPAGALPAGRWTTRTLYSSGTTAIARPLTVGGTEAIEGWTPFPTLAPMTGYIVELTAAR